MKNSKKVIAASIYSTEIFKMKRKSLQERETHGAEIDRLRGELRNVKQESHKRKKLLAVQQQFIEHGQHALENYFKVFLFSYSLSLNDSLHQFFHALSGLSLLWAQVVPSVQLALRIRKPLCSVFYSNVLNNHFIELKVSRWSLLKSHQNCAKSTYYYHSKNASFIHFLRHLD